MASQIGHIAALSWYTFVTSTSTALIAGCYALWTLRQKYTSGTRFTKDVYYLEALEALWQIRGRTSCFALSDRILDCCIQARQLVQKHGGLLTSRQVTVIVSSFSDGVVDEVYNFEVPIQKPGLKDEAVVPEVVLTTAELIGRRLGKDLKAGRSLALA